MAIPLGGAPPPGADGEDCGGHGVRDGDAEGDGGGGGGRDGKGAGVPEAQPAARWPKGRPPPPCRVLPLKRGSGVPGIKDEAEGILAKALPELEDSLKVLSPASPPQTKPQQSEADPALTPQRRSWVFWLCPRQELATLPPCFSSGDTHPKMIVKITRYGKIIMVELSQLSAAVNLPPLSLTALLLLLIYRHPVVSTFNL